MEWTTTGLGSGFKAGVWASYFVESQRWVRANRARFQDCGFKANCACLVGDHDHACRKRQDAPRHG